jgi:hypothetical protein
VLMLLLLLVVLLVPRWLLVEGSSIALKSDAPGGAPGGGEAGVGDKGPRPPAAPFLFTRLIVFTSTTSFSAAMMVATARAFLRAL